MSLSSPLLLSLRLKTGKKCKIQVKEASGVSPFRTPAPMLVGGLWAGQGRGGFG